MVEAAIPNDKFVFYSLRKQADAKKFCEANDGYHYYSTIFNDASKTAFSADPMNPYIAPDCSQAMAAYAAGETRVFGDKTGKLLSLSTRV
jgi:hypothetical protein